MAGRSKETSSISKLSREGPSLAEVLVMNAEGALIHLDDRAVAILEAANLDYALEDLIAYRTMPRRNVKIIDEIFVGASAPLATFSAKIKMAYAIGIVGKNTRAELNRLRKIRNAFAHARKPIRFDTNAVAKVCAMLKTPTRIGRPPNLLYDRAKTWPPKEPRSQYICTAIELTAAIYFSQYPDALRTEIGLNESVPLD